MTANIVEPNLSNVDISQPMVASTPMLETTSTSSAHQPTVQSSPAQRPQALQPWQSQAAQAPSAQPWSHPPTLTLKAAGATTTKWRADTWRVQSASPSARRPPVPIPCAGDQPTSGGKRSLPTPLTIPAAQRPAVCIVTEPDSDEEGLPKRKATKEKVSPTAPFAHEPLVVPTPNSAQELLKAQADAIANAKRDQETEAQRLAAEALACEQVKGELAKQKVEQAAAAQAQSLAVKFPS